MMYRKKKGSYVASGTTVLAMKLEQSAWRDVMGRRPARVPVTCRLQLLPAHSRFSMRAAKATAAKERMTADFIFV